MGTAGLDVKELIGMLERIKVDCSLVERDELENHCLLRLSSGKRPGRVALIEYVNIGSEPRVASIKIEPPEEPAPSQSGTSFWISEQGLNLRGPKSDDPKRIVELVRSTFLNKALG